MSKSAVIFYSSISPDAEHCENLGPEMVSEIEENYKEHLQSMGVTVHARHIEVPNAAFEDDHSTPRNVRAIVLTPDATLMENMIGVVNNLYSEYEFSLDEERPSLENFDENIRLAFENRFEDEVEITVVA